MSLGLRRKITSSTPPMDAGTYPAVCVGIVDLGKQYSEKFKKYSDKLMMIWEIPSQTVQIDDEDKPRWLSNDFTSSLHDKSNLYKTLVSWRGKPFTEEELSVDKDGHTKFKIKDMLGAGCFLQVIVEEKESGSYNRITSVIALPAGIEVPKTETPLIAFDMDAWDDEVFHSLPEWIQKRVKKSTQYQKFHVPTDPVDVDTSGGEAQKEENPI